MFDYLRSHPDLTSALLGALAFIAVYVVWTALLEKDNVTSRLKAVQQRRAVLKEAYLKQDKKKAGPQAHMSFIRSVSSWMKLQQLKGLDEVRKKLVRAGYRSRDSLMVFLFMQLVLPVLILALLALFLLVLTPPAKLTGLQSLIICLFFGILAGLLPNLFVKNKTQARLDSLRKALPDAFDLMVICAEAGLSLDATLDRVSREIMPSTPDLGEELALTGVELSFLPDRQAALRALADRVPLQGIQALVSTLNQTEKYGTPLAQALRILSGELRDERMMRAEEKAARLPAILTVPMILFILPPLFVVLIGPAGIKVSQMMSGG